MNKICKKHGLVSHSLRSDGRYRCRKCTVEAVQKRRHKIKEMAVSYKGGKCQNPNCNYNKYIGALDFHHLDNNDKDFSISQNGHTKSWEKLKIELDKCILLCANCHREAHAELLDVKNIESPTIHLENKRPIIKYCVDCGIIIDKDANRCVGCYNIFQRKITNRPTKEVLLKELLNSTYTSLGKKYCVSDNTIRNWIK